MNLYVTVESSYSLCRLTEYAECVCMRQKRDKDTRRAMQSRNKTLEAEMVGNNFMCVCLLKMFGATVSLQMSEGKPCWPFLQRSNSYSLCSPLMLRCPPSPPHSSLPPVTSATALEENGNFSSSILLPSLLPVTVLLSLRLSFCLACRLYCLLSASPVHFTPPLSLTRQFHRTNILGFKCPRLLGRNVGFPPCLSA